MGKDTVKLTAREDARWKKAIFSLRKYADGFDCNVSPTESNFRKLFPSGKKIKYFFFFFSRNISLLFEASFILTNYLSNL